MQSLSTFKRLAAILLLMGLVQAPLAHSAHIEIQPGTTSANAGDLISLDLVISGLGNYVPDSLGAFDISVGFDATALSFTGYSLGGFLGNIALLEAIDASTGNVVSGAANVAEVSLLSALDLDTLQPGAFTLATLNFTVINLAAGAATQLSVLLDDAVLADGSGSRLSATASGPASIQSVPVPATLLLLITGLCGWLIQMKRQSSLHQVH